MSNMAQWEAEITAKINPNVLTDAMKGAGVSSRALWKLIEALEKATDDGAVYHSK